MLPQMSESKRIVGDSIDAGETAALDEELRDVEARLVEALADLYAPLSGLALESLRETKPPVRALAVLVTGVRPGADPHLRERRILLGAALEMLAIALRIHNLLLVAANAATLDGATAAQQSLPEIDRSLAGSTILAGDYCFSRAAFLAAQTDSPTVVNIFSLALKNVSEGRLRASFDAHAMPYFDDAELVRAGVRGAAHMAGLTGAQVESSLAAAAALLAGNAPGQTIESDPNLTTQQRRRWHAAWQMIEHSALDA